MRIGRAAKRKVLKPLTRPIFLTIVSASGLRAADEADATGASGAGRKKKPPATRPSAGAAATDADDAPPPRDASSDPYVVVVAREPRGGGALDQVGSDDVSLKDRVA